MNDLNERVARAMVAGVQVIEHDSAALEAEDMTNDNAPDVEKFRRHLKCFNPVAGKDAYHTDWCVWEGGGKCLNCESFDALLYFSQALDAAHARIAELEDDAVCHIQYTQNGEKITKPLNIEEMGELLIKSIDRLNAMHGERDNLRAEVEALRDERDRYKRSHDILADKLEQQRIFREEVEWRKREDIETERKEWER